MATPVIATEDLVESSVSILVTGPGGFSQECELPAGDALVVGASPACGVRIQGEGIAAMHCTISYENGELVIDDWDTGAGTYVGTQRIARQATVEPGATLVIGEYRITSEIHHVAESEDAETAPYDTDEPMEQPASVPEVSASPLPAAEMESLLDEVDGVWDSPDDLSNQFLSDEEPVAGYDRGSYEERDDTTELLKIELDYLRTELAERDARVAELEQSGGAGSDVQDEDLPTRKEVETLVGRLEELLQELDHSDERLQTMTEMLRVSEEANQACEEERVQMESWIGEVERRVGAWESEWHAERDSMNKKIVELTAQRDEAESQGNSLENTQLIQKLRQEISRLETESARLAAERDDFQQRLDTADVQSVEDRVAEAVTLAMREERLHLSQAKAECARERAELMRQQEELSNRQGPHTSNADVADLKIRAFRQHLKEIRETEPHLRPAAPTMSQRLGKLWRKIDGHPLDTD